MHPRSSEVPIPSVGDQSTMLQGNGAPGYTSPHYPSTLLSTNQKPRNSRTETQRTSQRGRGETDDCLWPRAAKSRTSTQTSHSSPPQRQPLPSTNPADQFLLDSTSSYRQGLHCLYAFDTEIEGRCNRVARKPKSQ